MFLDAVADDRLYAMWHLFAFTGMRRGEMAGLRWPDIDLANSVLHIETELVQLGWEVDEDTPKTEASAAPVPIDKQAVALLKAWRKAQMADQAAMGPDWAKSGRVFTQLSGAALHPARITAMFEREAFDAQLPPIRLHDLRHGAATLAHAAGADIKAIQAMLRHANLAITADTYTTVLQETQSALAEGMGSVVPRLRPVSDPSDTLGPTTAPQPHPDPRESASWP
jgi:integrase